MAVVETRIGLWEALAGRAPGRPSGPTDADLWSAVVERVNPARARPRLRAGIEEAELVSARGTPYVMLRSPDPAAAYLRLTPVEWELARLMDGQRTVARLVAEFARISGRLAPDQVRRVVADLAGNRMLEELPVDAFRPLAQVRRTPWPVRLGRGLLATARGRRMLVVDVDPLLGLLYRAGGRFLFTPAVVVTLAVVAAAGLVGFGWTWWNGAESLFLSGGSYAGGAALLLGLNVLALACHELGHGLAAKHAGRRVPAAGVLVYFGIPSVFVDTTDVWMGGRPARLRTTAAGPCAGLLLAGIASLVGLAFPELAPLTFKLAFVWYLNALINLNPFLALDGYYLLMDWLEIPNLRARGLAWVLARMRPRWRQLDGEGRLIALYGLLAVLWLAIAANVAYRIYADRVAGLATGVWRSGWPGRLLLAAVVVGLAAPLVYAAAGWLAGRWRAARRWWAQRRVESDLPRRREVLRGSVLAAGLAPADLDALARLAWWRHPRTGTALVAAGTAHREVLVVADGAVEGRRPGDPGGVIRERVGPGGVVGLSAVLAGAPAALSWHTAGTSLLALPAGTVASVLGGASGDPAAGATGPDAASDRAEAEALFAETPGLAGLGDDERTALAARSRSISVPPGAPVHPPGPSEALVVAGGVVDRADGTELRRGSVILALAEGSPDVDATARTWARLWVVPVVAAHAPLAPAPGRAPRYGVHPPAGYAPLAVPPGPPPDSLDGTKDRWFEKRLRWLVLLLLLLLLLVTGTNLLPGPAWSEMPEDRALLTVDRGTAVATLAAGERVRLDRSDRLYLGAGDRIDVADGSRGRLTLRGGSAVLLCPGSAVAVGAVDSAGRRPVRPGGDLELVAGAALVDTASPSQAFVPSTLAVHFGAGQVAVNDGEAWYGVNPAGVRVALGEVTVDGATVRAADESLSCGDGVPVERPTGTPSPSPAPTPGASSTPSGSATPTPSASTDPSDPAAPPPPPGPDPGDPGPGDPGPGDPGTGDPDPGEPSPEQPESPSGPSPSPDPPRSSPPRSDSPTSDPPTSDPPPPNEPPEIQRVDGPGGRMTLTYKQRACTDNYPHVLTYTVLAVDENVASLTATLRYSGAINGSVVMTGGSGKYTAEVGPFPWEEYGDLRGEVSVEIEVVDDQGKRDVESGASIELVGCPLIG